MDRVIVNAYFRMGIDGGGIRCWWRALTGSDAGLDNAHLMRMAGRFSRRLRAWAKANHVPVEDCPPGARKHELAQQYLANNEVQNGLFLVLVSRSPAVLWDVPMSGSGKIGNIGKKKPQPYVNHYHFHILDPEVESCRHLVRTTDRRAATRSLRALDLYHMLERRTRPRHRSHRA